MSFAQPGMPAMRTIGSVYVFFYNGPTLKTKLSQNLLDWLSAGLIHVEAPMPSKSQIISWPSCMHNIEEAYSYARLDVTWSVCLCVCYSRELYKKSWTNQYADSCGSKEPCIIDEVISPKWIINIERPCVSSFRLTEGRWYSCHSIGHTWFPICLLL